MSLIAKKFYYLFWSDQTCQRIFSLHRTQLLEDEVELILTKEKGLARRLVLTNSLVRKTEMQVVERTKNENIELLHNLKNAASKYLDETKIDQYFKEKFGKSITKLEKDFNGSGLLITLPLKLSKAFRSEKDFLGLLSEYELIPKGIESISHLINHIEAALKGEIQSYLKGQNLPDLAISIDLLSAYYNHKVKQHLVNSTKHYTDTLYDTENYNDRILLFDKLYEIKAINGGVLKGYYECVNCPTNTFNGIVSIDIKPSKLKLKCPCCSKELLYMIPYEIDRQIYEHITQKDGLLHSAIEYLLGENNVSFQSNQTLGKDIEIDICLLDKSKNIYETIEVKVFKTDRPEDTQVGNCKYPQNSDWLKIENA